MSPRRPMSWQPLPLVGLAATLLATMLLAAQASAACQADGAQYSTTFSQPDDSWALNDNIKIGGGDPINTVSSTHPKVMIAGLDHARRLQRFIHADEPIILDAANAVDQ